MNIKQKTKRKKIELNKEFCERNQSSCYSKIFNWNSLLLCQLFHFSFLFRYNFAKQFDIVLNFTKSLFFFFLSLYPFHICFRICVLHFLLTLFILFSQSVYYIHMYIYYFVYTVYSLEVFKFSWILIIIEANIWIVYVHLLTRKINVILCEK